MIPFNAPPVVGTELDYMQSAMGSGKLCGDGGFTRRCQQWMEQRFHSAKVLLTPSCTASLEMAALLLDIGPGDEVIMPSYTFVSTANAFVLRGAKIVFVDVRPDTMNIDERLIEAAITDKTRAIVPVHYAGVACEMDTIMAIAKKTQPVRGRRCRTGGDVHLQRTCSGHHWSCGLLQFPRDQELHRRR
jgi:dTDP-4-amino-4,6-dideoxygalactose transaminase